MHLVYEDTKEEILAVERKAKHQPPHLHQTMELVYVMKGSLELGVGLELFHMEEGDIGLIFPDVIHHCQVFSEQYSEVLHINVPTRTLGTYEELLKIQDSNVQECFKYIGVLISGEYIDEKNDNKTALIASTNQKMYFFRENLREKYKKYMDEGRQIQNVFWKDELMSIGIHNSERSV